MSSGGTALVDMMWGRKDERKKGNGEHGAARNGKVIETNQIKVGT